MEFKYAVAGLLGISEILRRLEKLEESLVRLWEEVRALREGQHRLFEEMRDVCVVLRGISTTLERLTLTVEEEAREIIKVQVEEGAEHRGRAG